jgi:hypothetical protein
MTIIPSWGQAYIEPPDTALKLGKMMPTVKPHILLGESFIKDMI